MSFEELMSAKKYFWQELVVTRAYLDLDLVVNVLFRHFGDFARFRLNGLCKIVLVVRLLPFANVSLKKFSKWRLLGHVKIRGRVWAGLGEARDSSAIFTPHADNRMASDMHVFISAVNYTTYAGISSDDTCRIHVAYRPPARPH